MSHYINVLKREWELSILVVMILIGLVGFVAGSIKAINFWGGAEEKPKARVNVKAKFSDKAFAYLNPEPAHQIGSNHAMKLELPQEWLNKKQYEQMLADRERRRREAEMRRKAEIDRMANMLANDKTRPTQQPNEPKPNPPISHYMVFKGFMQSPKGEVLAYLGKEDAQEEVVKRTGATFLRVDGQFKGYTVKEINDDWLRLTEPNGNDLTLIRGQRHQYDVTQNPDYLLEPDEPKTDDDVTSTTPVPRKPGTNTAGKTAGTNRSGQSKSPQEIIQDYLKKNKGNPNSDMVKEYLKKNKGKIDQKSIQELMRKNRVRHEDVERLFR